MTEKTCAERIGEHLAGRLTDLDKLNAGLPLDGAVDSDNPTDDEREQAQDELAEYPLGISAMHVYRVDLSTGGPADWLELFYLADGEGIEHEPTRIVYHFADWFDHAERTLEGDEFETVATAFEWLGDNL